MAAPRVQELGSAVPGPASKDREHRLPRSPAGWPHADLPYYCELARRADSTLELGAGTGRVALELAALTDLWANDLDDPLLEELVRRAEARGLSVTPVPGDATKLDLGRPST